MRTANIDMVACKTDSMLSYVNCVINIDSPGPRI